LHFPIGNVNGPDQARFRFTHNGPKVFCDLKKWQNLTPCGEVLTDQWRGRILNASTAKKLPMVRSEVTSPHRHGSTDPHRGVP